MIFFDADSRRFNLRAAAIVLNGSQVLLHRLEGDAFWSFPGGRVEGENSGLRLWFARWQSDLPSRSNAVSCCGW